MLNVKLFQMDAFTSANYEETLRPRMEKRSGEAAEGHRRRQRFHWLGQSASGL